MDVIAAASIARDLMNLHGLQDWGLKFDRAKRRFGQCNHRTKTISLSSPLVRMNAEEDVRDTILHEIAHAKVGREHGHDWQWRNMALLIGASGDRLYDADKINAPPGQWIGTCPNCGHHTRPRHRRRKGSCSRCSTYYDPRFELVWTRSDQ